MIRFATAMAIALGLFTGIETAAAQYYTHGDFGGYTYRSPYRNYTYSYRYNTASTYLRSGRLTNFQDASGASGLMPTGPTLRVNTSGVRGPSISNLGPSLPGVAGSPAPAPVAPTIGVYTPTTRPAEMAVRPATTPTAGSAGATAGPVPQTSGYSPFADEAWMAKRHLYHIPR